MYSTPHTHTHSQMLIAPSNLWHLPPSLLPQYPLSHLHYFYNIPSSTLTPPTIPCLSSPLLPCPPSTGELFVVGKNGALLGRLKMEAGEGAGLAMAYAGLMFVPAEHFGERTRCVCVRVCVRVCLCVCACVCEIVLQMVEKVYRTSLN